LRRAALGSGAFPTTGLIALVTAGNAPIGLQKHAGPAYFPTRPGSTLRLFGRDVMVCGSVVVLGSSLRKKCERIWLKEEEGGGFALRVPHL